MIILASVWHHSGFGLLSIGPHFEAILGLFEPFFLAHFWDILAHFLTVFTVILRLFGDVSGS